MIGAAGPTISKVRFEHHPTGLGVEASPRLSWRYEGDITDWHQHSYDVEVKRYVKDKAETKQFSVGGKSSVLNAWPDAPLSPRERAEVRVLAHGVSGTDRADTAWSPWSTVEASLLSKDEWAASVISTTVPDEARQTGGNGIRPIRFRKAFKAPSSVVAARLYITAYGLYEVYINGERVGSDHMTPGWQTYHHRLQYQVYDVLDHVQAGTTNVLAIEVAEGWYAGRLSAGAGYPLFYGSELGVLAQLELFDKPWSRKPSFQVVTDESWLTKLSPITSSQIYDGEVYDDRLQDGSWHEPSSPSGWYAAKKLPLTEGELLASPEEGVRITQTIRPVEVHKSPSGRTIVDFGQNFAGRILIHSLKRRAGHTVSIRHAEVLENGELGMRPLRGARATDTITIGPSGVLENWSPRFTFHGFRYVDFDGWNLDDADGPLNLDAISGLVLHTDMERTGHFSCSNALVNRLHENVVWSMRSNFFSLPTDCPQRDERMGWTGDIQVFAPTASYLFNCAGFLSDWLGDLVADQKAANGLVPNVSPSILPKTEAQAVWDDAVILVPWVLYKRFGDVQVLRDNYQGMQDYLDRVLPRTSDGLWNPDVWQLGDWLDPNAPPAEPGLARTDGALVADEYLVHVTEVLAKIAAIIDKKDDAIRYGDDTRRLRSAFHAKYVAPSGLVVGDSQTSLALAIVFGLHGHDAGADDATTVAQRSVAGARLGRLVRYAKFRVSTGFAGTPAILHALSSAGQLQLAYRMLLEQSLPSWLYVVNMGGTTVWERWDSMLPDGSINPGEMTSFNHYALGAVADWLHVVVGGLRPLDPGWSRFAAEPRPGGDVTSATTSFVTPAGRIECTWQLAGEPGAQTFVMALTVPPNHTAVVVLPHGGDAAARKEETVGSGRHVFKVPFVPEGEWPPSAISQGL